MTRKILFVAMQMSMHTVRWIKQIADQEWDLHIFPVNYLPVHPEMQGVTVHQPWRLISPRLIAKTALTNPRKLLGGLSGLEESQHPNKLPVHTIYPLLVPSPMARILNGAKRVRLGESDAQAPYAYGPRALARLIANLKPDLIHSLEFQHCGYNVLRAKELSNSDFPPWIATNWGSDIYYYRQFEDHRKQISRLLRNIDFYSCECARDVGLAHELGLTGKAMQVMPNTGGLDLAEIGLVRATYLPSQRRLIMVKGYQHFAGRGLMALDVIERCASSLKNYQIVVFSASPDVAARAEKLGISLGLNITLLPHSSHDTVLRMFSRARIYLGISVSDAISTSMLEAIAMGAFPIQTDTACCDEWIEDGKSGFIIPPDDINLIADRLLDAVTNNPLVDQAAELNWSTVQERLDQKVLKKQAIAFYDEIFQDL
ncbi:MAG: glycosyltransferase [Geopsychrobacter sp.]|nr:glycosyltransferase [Geopsychrobacter sp.]